MMSTLKNLIPPLASLVLMILGSGLFNTFISLRLEMEGFDPEVIGIVTSALYVGILLGSLRIDRWISRVGHIYSFTIFAAVMTLLILLQASWLNPWYWAGLRLLGGICIAGVFIVIESWLLMLATPALRGAILSIYLGVFYAALSLGQLLINVADPRTAAPFFVTAALTALSILPITFKKIEAPKIESSTPMGLIKFFKISRLGFLGGVISGMLLAVVYGLLPVYANEMGMTVSEIGTLMAILIFGGLSLQWPLGRWADRGKRRLVLNIASFLTTAFGLSIAMQNPIDPVTLLILAWFFGGFSFTLYPLSMAYVCEKVGEDQIVAATGGFVLSYGIGAIAGPLVAPLFMDWLGSSGLFYFLSLITLLLGLTGLKKKAPVQIDIVKPEE
ncbi:MAG: MFS transporter [Verrucomicrobia bacterium]|nr:MFS transporter [Verrucomicrobiota bacterium]